MLQNPPDFRCDEFGEVLDPMTPEEMRSINRVRGVAEWVPEKVSYAMIKHLAEIHGDGVEIEEDSIKSINNRVKNQSCFANTANAA